MRRRLLACGITGAVAIGAGVAAVPASAAVPPPPRGATSYAISHACQPFVTSAGHAQVRITGTASTHVYRMPKKPILVPDPHRIYQQVKVSLQRRVLGGWKGEQRSFTTALTTTGQVNSGVMSHGASYGPATADGATFRVRITVRVFTERDGLPDRVHWRYQAYGPTFSCPASGLLYASP